MITAPAKMWVMAGEQFTCVKISGRANFSSSIDLKTVVQELRRKGCSYFVLELSECTLMDSTFLGVLAGLGLQSTATGNSRDASVIELLNPNERITELLESLGVLHLFKLTEGPLPDGMDVRPLAQSCPTKEDVKRACLEAHRTLMQLSPENAAKFKDVAAFLAEDLKKAKPAP